MRSMITAAVLFLAAASLLAISPGGAAPADRASTDSTVTLVIIGPHPTGYDCPYAAPLS